MERSIFLPSLGNLKSTRTQVGSIPAFKTFAGVFKKSLKVVMYVEFSRLRALRERCGRVALTCTFKKIADSKKKMEISIFLPSLGNSGSTRKAMRTMFALFPHLRCLRNVYEKIV